MERSFFALSRAASRAYRSLTDSDEVLTVTNAVDENE
jgi:hypothetical protein